ncbi:MAG: DUF3619 family protein [Dechloromonas sp.]|nr:MAG: DUF3619 family protein [Dechloromonas sp.]
MNEERYASRVRQALNHGLNDISPAVARRLEAARHQALSARSRRHRNWRWQATRHRASISDSSPTTATCGKRWHSWPCCLACGFRSTWTASGTSRKSRKSTAPCLRTTCRPRLSWTRISSNG